MDSGEEGSQEDVQGEPEVQSKKRERMPSLWKRNKSKVARLKGVEYEDYKGRPKPALAEGQLCRCKRLKCFEKISEDEATDLFKRIHDLPSKNEQDLYIQSLIEAHSVKQHRPRKIEPRKVDNMFTYFFVIGGKRIEVCYKAFLSVQAITDKRVKRLRKLLLEGKTPEDKRGKAQSANTLPPESREILRHHIESFPTKVSRYSSGKTKLYLDARLSVASMYRLFKDKYPDLKCSYNFFNAFFNNNYNLTFGRPQIDTCTTCEEIQLKLKSPRLSENVKRVSAAELIVHKRKAKKFYNALKHEAEMKNEPHVLSLCMDYMQNVPIPQIPIQDTFYMRQLTLNVFCIHDIKKNTAMIYLYHEGTANKGPDEVCSFLNDYLKDVSPSYTELRLFADNCSGQNKNHALARFLLALTQTNKFKKVQQYFPVRGHSFLPCDRDFATIKRELKKHDRLYDVATVRNLILLSSKVGKFTVKEVDTSEILAFKNWWQNYYKRTVVSEETRPRNVPKDDKVRFGISSLTHSIYNEALPGAILCSTTINSNVKHTFRLAHNSQDKVQLPQQQAYPNGKVPIKKAKINDLVRLLPYIPNDFSEFYQEIVNWPTTEEEIDINIQDD